MLFISVASILVHPREYISMHFPRIEMYVSGRLLVQSRNRGARTSSKRATPFFSHRLSHLAIVGGPNVSA